MLYDAFGSAGVPAMTIKSEEGIVDLCPDEKKRAIPGDAWRVIRMIEHAHPGIFEEHHRKVLEGSLILAFETACILNTVIQQRRGVLSRWQAELLLQSLLLIVGISTTTSVWNLFTNQLSEVLAGSAAWQPRASTQSNVVAEFLESVNALAVTQTAEEACARITELWRDACRGAGHLIHLLLVSSGSSGGEVHLPSV